MVFFSFSFLFRRFLLWLAGFIDFCVAGGWLPLVAAGRLSHPLGLAVISGRLQRPEWNALCLLIASRRLACLHVCMWRAPVLDYSGLRLAVAAEEDGF